MSTAQALLHPFLRPLLPLASLLHPSFPAGFTSAAAAPIAAAALPARQNTSGISLLHSKDESASQTVEPSCQGTMTHGAESSSVRVQLVKPAAKRASLSTGGVAALPQPSHEVVNPATSHVHFQNCCRQRCNAVDLSS